MRATRLLVLSCCVIAICASARPVAVDSVIRGVVTDPDGKPIAGALVKATDTGGIKSVSRYTSADGRYELTVSPGQYGVVAEAFGFGPERRSMGAATDGRRDRCRGELHADSALER